MQQYTLVEAVITNGATVVLLGIFIRVWINNINKNITKLFDRDDAIRKDMETSHDKCVENDDCIERQASIARKVHSEGEKCKAKANIDLLKHYHDGSGKVMGI